MLDRIHLENFKAAKDVEIRLAPLTVLAGLNGSGKSTLLQSIGALRQSYEQGEHTRGLSLSGGLVQLGKGYDVLHDGAETDEIRIALWEGELGYQWVCASPPNSDLNQLAFTEQPRTQPRFVSTPDFQFLQADRIVPRTLYPQAPYRARNTSFLGTRGEYTADFLALHGDRVDVPSRRRAEASGSANSSAALTKRPPTARLADQTAAWMQMLSPGIEVQAERAEGTDEVRLRYRYAGRERDVGSSLYRATNVGFGITYSLPIITACLAAPPGGLLLLENPEAHLHPQGQVALAELFGRCAADGVQIIVETHSDHILNGVRLAVKRRIAGFSNQHVALHCFTRDPRAGETWVQSPAISENGKLSNWPEGFFDQWSKTIDALLE